MFPFIPCLNHEYLKQLNKNILLKNDNQRLQKLKECIDNSFKNPGFSFNSGLYYSYLLKEYNELKKKLDTYKPISEETDFFEIDDLSIKEYDNITIKNRTYWYNPFITIFNL